MSDQQQQLYSVKFPLVGIRSDGDPFQYLPIISKSKTLSFAIHNWFVNRAVLNIGEQVDLLVPFFVRAKNPFIDSTYGTITSIQPNAALKAMEHTLIFSDAIEITPIEEWNLESFLKQSSQPSIDILELLLKVVKDIVLLKSGVRIYLKHLRAYLSRIFTQSASEYLNLNNLLLSDIEKRVKDNESHLKDWLAHLNASLKSVDDIPLIIQLEDLREKVESEIPFSLVSLAFNQGHSDEGSDLRELLNPRLSNQCIAYLQAVKTLEKRLYVNYNVIALIYSYTLEAILPAD